MSKRKEREDGRDWRGKKKTDRGGNRLPSSSKGSQQSDAWAERLNPASMQKGSGVGYTISMAIPSSFLNSAQTRELKTYLVSQIARAAVLHEVDEIVVFIDTAAEAASDDADRTPSMFLCRLLQYLECPAYLRKAFFPVHGDLALAGIMPQLDTPHHMRRENVSMFREGVVVEDKVAARSLLHKDALLRVQIARRRCVPSLRMATLSSRAILGAFTIILAGLPFPVRGATAHSSRPR